MAWGATEELHLRGAAPSAPCSPRARPGTESPPAHPHNPDIGAPWSRRPAGRLRPARSRGQEEKRVRPRESNERQTAPRLRGLGTKGQQATTAGRDRHRSTPVEYTPSQRRGMWAPEYSCPSRPSFQGRFSRFVRSRSSWRASPAPAALGRAPGDKSSKDQRLGRPGGQPEGADVAAAATRSRERGFQVRKECPSRRRPGRSPVTGGGPDAAHCEWPVTPTRSQGHRRVRPHWQAPLPARARVCQPE